MDLNARLRTVRDLDPDTLSETELRETLVPALLGVAEDLLAGMAALQTQVRQLQDEIARLKGEQGRPQFPSGRGKGVLQPLDEPPGPASHSSEAARRGTEPPPPRRKGGKQDRLVVTREMLCPWVGALPADAKFKGYVPVVVQDLALHVDTVRFQRAKYYAPSTGKTYLGPLPPGYQGQFGPGVRSLALALVYGAQLSHPLVHGFLSDAGVVISASQVSWLVTHGLEPFHTEQAAVLAAGLRSSPWQHLDVTSTRVDGEEQACHVLGNPLFAAYRTLPRQDRGAALDTLRGGAPRQYRLDATAFTHLATTGVAVRWRTLLARFPQEVTWDAPTFARQLDLWLPRLGREARKHIEDAAAIAAYRADPGWPVVQCLIVDDAASFRGLTREIALCWVHDARHYTKLNPQFACHRHALGRFQKQYWQFYRELLAYRQAPRASEAARLAAQFDQVFGVTAGWVELETCVRRTQAHKEKLLRVLVHPELLLHNNPAELLARRRVRKRDVSFGPRSPTGVRAWDTFQGLVETTRKLGIRFWTYLRTRLTEGGDIPPLAELITARAQDLQLGASWSNA
jgi:hypothetical protein